jgi:hypothetical protein
MDTQHYLLLGFDAQRQLIRSKAMNDTKDRACERADHWIDTIAEVHIASVWRIDHARFIEADSDHVYSTRLPWVD